jgi:hypothetical protein
MTARAQMRAAPRPAWGERRGALPNPVGLSLSKPLFLPAEASR